MSSRVMNFRKRYRGRRRAYIPATLPRVISTSLVRLSEVLSPYTATALDAHIITLVSVRHSHWPTMSAASLHLLHGCTYTIKLIHRIQTIYAVCPNTVLFSVYINESIFGSRVSFVRRGFQSQLIYATVDLSQRNQVVSREPRGTLWQRIGYCIPIVHVVVLEHRRKKITLLSTSD